MGVFFPEPLLLRRVKALVGGGVDERGEAVEFDVELGFLVGQSGQINGSDGRFVYFETDAHPGSVIELSEISGPKGRFFEAIRTAAEAWDGSEPIRRLGQR